MPNPCPSCGRPNAETATRCLYCAGPMDRAPRGASAPASEAVPVFDRHLIILAPQPEGAASDERVRGFAEVLGLALYDARLALQSRRYRLLRKVDSAGAAQEMDERLTSLEIAHFRIAERDVEAMPVEMVRSLVLGRDEIEAFLENRTRLPVAYQDLLILVRGEITRERHKEHQMGTPQGASQPLTPGLRLHIYPLDARSALELDAERFDWSTLNGCQSPSTPLKLKRLVEALRERAPAVEIDHGFDWEPVVLSLSEDAGELATILGERNREGNLNDNSRQFRFYARWRYQVAVVEGLVRRGGGSRIPPS